MAPVRPSKEDNGTVVDLLRRTANGSRIHKTTVENIGWKKIYTHKLHRKADAEIQYLLHYRLSKRDQQPGTVYLMRDLTTPNFFKVGMTRKTAHARAQGIKSSCGRELHPIAEIRYHHGSERAEALVLSELLQYRELIDCGRCGREHKEYFQVPEEKIWEIFKRWTGWMEQNPYEELGSLKSEWRQQRDDVNRWFGGGAHYGKERSNYINAWLGRKYSAFVSMEKKP